MTGLSARETEIFSMLLDGKSPKEIAYDLKITYNTVISHQKSIYRKLEVQNINELLIKFRQTEAPQQPDKKSALIKIAAAAFFALAIITLLVLAPWKDSTYVTTDKIIRVNKRAALDTQLDYDLFLSRLLETAEEPAEWHICMGEGDWSYSWFARKFSEAQSSEKFSSKISGIFVRHLNPETAEKLERDGVIREGFRKRLLENVEGLRRLCDAHGIGFGVSYYDEDSLPEWHGHLYGNWVLRGKWSPVSGGVKGVQTGLEAVPSADKEFSGMRKYFTGVSD